MSKQKREPPADELAPEELERIAGGGEATDEKHKEWIDVLAPPPPPPPPPPRK
jgi:hypothetical protein